MRLARWPSRTTRSVSMLASRSSIATNTPGAPDATAEKKASKSEPMYPPSVCDIEARMSNSEPRAARKQQTLDGENKQAPHRREPPALERTLPSVIWMPSSVTVLGKALASRAS